MISYDDIRELQQYPSGNDSCVLSLYVNVNQANAANLNRGFERAAADALRRLAEASDPALNHRDRFEAEARRALDFLRDYVPKGKGLVLFSDARGDLWWQRDLQVDLPTEARWSPRPWLRPLLEVIEDNDAFAVVLIDKQRARVLTVDATGVRQHAELESDVPNRHASTGSDQIMSQSQMERDHDNHVRSHARRATEELAAVMERTRLSRLVVGGPVEATALFTTELPKRFQQMIIGTVSVPIDANGERLLSELRAVQERFEHADEEKLVETIITAAHKQGRGVLGIRDLLDAINQSRVMRMVVTRGFRAQGRECGRCGVLVLDGDGVCAFCGGPLEVAPDLINRASHRVIEQNGKVHMVSGNAAEKLGASGVGALLRF